METISFIYSEDNSIRVDKFLAQKLTSHTRSEISKIIDNKHVKVNNQIVKKSFKLHLDDQIEVQIPEPTVSEVLPQKMDLDILYEDDEIILINKKQGVVVHPGAGNWDSTLVNGLLYHCQDLKGIGGVLRPGVVHRIDKDTTGILVFAKTQIALNHIAAQFKEHTNVRKYLAIIRGIPSVKEGRIETFIERDPHNRLKFTSKTTKGKVAITNYKVLESYQHFSLIEATLETGRTHQIRVHFADMNHPLIGDPLYGYGVNHFKFLPHELYRHIKNLKGQMLHAKYLEITHPKNKNRISFEIKAHQDFLDLLNLIKKFN